MVLVLTIVIAGGLWANPFTNWVNGIKDAMEQHETESALLGEWKGAATIEGYDNLVVDGYSVTFYKDKTCDWVDPESGTTTCTYTIANTRVVII